MFRYLDYFPSSELLGDTLSPLAGHWRFILQKEKPSPEGETPGIPGGKYGDHIHSPAFYLHLA